MKKTVLIAFLLLSASAFAQFTQANEPAIGAYQTMYVCDTLATSYAATTGTNVIWDYSNLAGISDGSGGFEQKILSVVSAASTPAGADYPSSTKASVIEGFVTTYFNSTASLRKSQGFSFVDGSATTNVKLDTDEENLMNYPFAQGNTLTDPFSGHVTYMSSPLVVTGTINAGVDGTGTIKLNATTTVNNITRYKLVENASANTPFGPITLTRTQYEYYNLANDELPVFVHSTMVVNILGAPNTIVVVLNTVQPDGTLGIHKNQLSGLVVYPNPATDVLSVKGLQENALLALVDVQGKTITSAAVEPGIASLAIDQVNAGVYFLHIATENGMKVERVVIR